MIAMTVGVEHGHRSQPLGFQSPQYSPPRTVAEARVNENGPPLFTHHYAHVDDSAQIIDVVLDVYKFH
jgi:hypothetical protein